MEKAHVLLISALILGSVIAGAEAGRAMPGDDVYVPEGLLGLVLGLG